MGLKPTGDSIPARRRVHRSRGTAVHWGGAGRTAAAGRGAPAATARRQAMSGPTADITRLLRLAASGDRAQLDALMAAIYEDLRRLAVSHMQGERGDHTLQPTAVVHEAYVKLIDQRNTDWKDRLHFFAIASRIIRRILIDHARERSALKRGGGGTRIGIDDRELSSPAEDVDLLALDEALEELAAIDERQARIVELRFFGGCTVEEIAELLEMGKRSVDREWNAAKAWLYCRLSEGRTGEAEPGDA
jgi:RNA polymerase sigma-70 factor (ECF subfamily)